MNKTSLSSGDPRLTALACGEIIDAEEIKALHEAIERDPVLSHEYAEICALQKALQADFASEVANSMPVIEANNSIPFKRKTASSLKSTESSRRRGRSLGGMIARPERKESAISRIIRYTVGAGVGIGVAAALVLTIKSPSTSPANSSSHPVIADNGSSAMRLQLATPRQDAGNSIWANGPGNQRIALPGNNESGLAALVARLPVRIPGGGENGFVGIRHEQSIPLSLTSAGQAYASRLQSHLVAGRLPPKDQLRIDGMVNAFLAVAPKSTAPGITIEAEVVPTPWANGHWLVRATILAGEIDGMIIAENAQAAVTFAPEQVSSWRMLGCEDGPSNAIAMDVPGVVRSGEMLTTLFELLPAEGAKAGEPVGEVKFVFQAKDGTRTEIKQKINYPAAGGLAVASDETRFAAAIASFGLTVRDSQYRGTASLSMANQLAANVENSGKPLFVDLLREAAPLVR